MAEEFDKVKLSKSLAWLLRHNAEKNGFKVLPGGFLPVEAVLSHARFKGFTMDNVQTVVKNCEKQRFSLKTEDGVLLIRANQGHSMKEVQVDMEEITSAANAPKVIHGTNLKAWQSIRTEGLSRMNRQHIHCAAGEPGEAGVISGMRSCCQIYIYLDLESLLRDEIRFYRSANNVILSPGDQDGIIKPKYFLKVRDVRKNVVIYP